MGDGNHSGIIDPGGALDEGDRLYSPNGRCRLGIRDGRMATDHVDTGTIVSSSGDQINGTRIGLATTAAAILPVQEGA